MVHRPPPPVPQITGPLIRIIGDRFPWQIKAAILHTLGLLIRYPPAAAWRGAATGTGGLSWLKGLASGALPTCPSAPPPCGAPPSLPPCSKAGAGLKPFVLQLQTTFVKCLSDPQKEARDHGGLASFLPAFLPFLLPALPFETSLPGCLWGSRAPLALLWPLLSALNSAPAERNPSSFLPPCTACLQVRQKAAANLGELARMSMRADQLVSGEPRLVGWTGRQRGSGAGQNRSALGPPLRAPRRLPTAPSVRPSPAQTWRWARRQQSLRSRRPTSPRCAARCCLLATASHRIPSPR